MPTSRTERRWSVGGHWGWRIRWPGRKGVARTRRVGRRGRVQDIRGGRHGAQLRGPRCPRRRRRGRNRVPRPAGGRRGNRGKGMGLEARRVVGHRGRICRSWVRRAVATTRRRGGRRRNGGGRIRCGCGWKRPLIGGPARRSGGYFVVRIVDRLSIHDQKVFGRGERIRKECRKSRENLLPSSLQ